MNQTRNPVITMHEHHKPLDQPGIYIVLNLIYYIQCPVMPFQTSTTQLLMITDHHTHHYPHTHTPTHQQVNNRPPSTRTMPGLEMSPRFVFFFSFFSSFSLLMMSFTRTAFTRQPSTTNHGCHVTSHHTTTFAHHGEGLSQARGSKGSSR